MISYLVFWAEQKSLNPFLPLTLDFEGATNATPLINPPRFVTDVFWPDLNLVSWIRSDLSRNSAGADWKIHKFWVAITTQAAATPVLKMRAKPQTLNSISMLEIFQHPKTLHLHGCRSHSLRDILHVMKQSSQHSNFSCLRVKT